MSLPELITLLSADTVSVSTPLTSFALVLTFVATSEPSASGTFELHPPKIKSAVTTLESTILFILHFL